MTQFGIQMYTLREFMKTPEDFDNTLRRVAEMGYTNVQISRPAFATAPEMAKQLKDYGLQADSAYCPVYEIPYKLDAVVEEAKLLGTDVVRTNSMHNPEMRADFEIFADWMNKCGRLLHDKGLKFMYHFHSFEFMKLGEDRGIDILLNNTDPELVYFQPDVFWLTAAGHEPSRALEMFRGRAIYMHCKDYVIVRKKGNVLEETSRASAPVGTGNLHWNEIIEAAKKVGIYNFVVEDDMGILDPFDSAKQSIDNMKKLGF